jgi:hypothetical protein
VAQDGLPVWIVTRVMQDGHRQLATGEYMTLSAAIAAAYELNDALQRETTQ